MSEWIKCSEQMPPDDDREIFIKKTANGEWYMTPANEIWFEVSEDSLHEWEWTQFSEKIYEELQ